MMWFPFIVISIAVLIVDIKTVLFISCLFVAVTITIDQQSKSDLQGILFFILALNIFNDKVSLIVVIFSAFAGILGRAFILSMSITETLILLIGFIACFMIFYIPRLVKEDV